MLIQTYNEHKDKMSLSKNQTELKKSNFAKWFDNKREIKVKFLMKNKKHKIYVKAEKTECFPDIYGDLDAGQPEVDQRGSPWYEKKMF